MKNEINFTYFSQKLLIFSKNIILIKNYYFFQKLLFSSKIIIFLKKGAYNTITLAVYGAVAKDVPSVPVTIATPPTTMSCTTLTSSVPRPSSVKKGLALCAPSLGHRTLTEKVNTNERIRNWLQESVNSQISHDSELSPSKPWEEDSNFEVILSPPIHKEPVISPPRSPSQSPTLNRRVGDKLQDTIKALPSSPSSPQPIVQSPDLKQRSELCEMDINFRDKKKSKRSKDDKKEKRYDKASLSGGESSRKFSSRLKQPSDGDETSLRNSPPRREFSPRPQEDSAQNKDDSSCGKGELQRKRDDSSHNRDDSLQNKDDTFHINDDSPSSKDETSHRRADSPLCKEGASHRRDDSLHMFEDLAHSKHAKKSDASGKRRTKDPSPNERLPLMLEEAMEAISDDEELPEVTPSSERKEVCKRNDSIHDILEEIMSDEEELPDFEDKSIEHQVIDTFEMEDRYDDWTHRLQYMGVQEFESVVPLVHLTSVDRHADALIKQELERLLENTAAPGDTDDDKEIFVRAMEQAVLLIPGLNLSGTDETGQFNESGKADVHKVYTESDLNDLDGKICNNEKNEKLNQSLHALIKQLCAWVCLGLDMDVAMAQEQPVYKIRHLKAGFRLCAAMCCCNELMTSRLLHHTPLLETLGNLYATPHMSVSVRLLIVRCYDVLLTTQCGIELFFGIQKELSHNGYELLVKLLSASKSARVKFNISSILRKVHLLEVLQKLHTDVGRLSQLTVGTSPKCSKCTLYISFFMIIPV